jgi:hypothetical protein
MFSEKLNAVPLQCSCGVSAGTFKMNKDKTQDIYFSHRRRPVEAYLTLKGWKVHFVNNVKYLDVTFDKKLHGEYI